MYYVYEWYIVETGEIIYVGKGTGRRYKVRKHNKFFGDMIRRFHCESRIVKEFESEKEAFDYEFVRVNELKAKGQCVCNIYDGGFGGSTEWWTDEIRERYSSHNAMKSAKQRERMSKENPMKRKEVSEKTNAQKRVAVIIADVEYESIKAACNAYNVTAGTINGWCIKGLNSKGETCKYKNAHSPEKYVQGKNGQKRPVTYKGIHYPSSTEMGLALGISQTTAARWCRQGRDSYGNPCKYDDDTRQNGCSPKQKSIPIIVNGKWYSSKEAASRLLGISSYTITQYLNGKKKDTEYICKYDNQQPSQGNVDKITLEGSTTNG